MLASRVGCFKLFAASSAALYQCRPRFQFCFVLRSNSVLLPFRYLHGARRNHWTRLSELGATVI